uniref:Transcription initiation factor TFIID subunit 9 n=1 Tax=Cacopsylla melanoneura TaxID=428564 RepID=A0A8D8RMZ2_9HEMI
MTSCRPVEFDAMANVNAQSSTSKLPRDAQVIVNMFQEAGIKNYDPRCVQQMLEFVNNYTTTILEDSRVYANHAKKKTVDLEDIKLAVTNQLSGSFAKPPPREVLLQLAAERNALPLPAVKPHCGIRLPPERFCLHQADYALASAKLKSKSGQGGMSNSNKAPPTKAAMKTVPQARLNVGAGVHNQMNVQVSSSAGVPTGNFVMNTGVGTGMSSGQMQTMLSQVKEENASGSNFVQSMDTL